MINWSTAYLFLSPSELTIRTRANIHRQFIKITQAGKKNIFGK